MSSSVEPLTSAKTFGLEIGEARHSSQIGYCTIDSAAGYTKSGAPFVVMGGRDLWMIAEQVKALLEKRKAEGGFTTELQAMLCIVENACAVAAKDGF